MTGAPETLEHLDVDPALRPLARALALRGASWWVLVQLELRKLLGTRWGRWFPVWALLLAVGAVVRAPVPAPVELGSQVGAVSAVLVLVVPLLGVLATTTEWSRRTALSTFALVPQRGRVLAAKVAAALLLALGAAAAGVLVALVAAAQAGRSTGVPPVLDDVGAVAASLGVTALAALAGAGLGALVGATTPAVAAVGAMAAVHLAPGALGDVTPWVDAPVAFGRVLQGDLAGWPQTTTALGVWLVLPLVAGSARWLRREVA